MNAEWMAFMAATAEDMETRRASEYTVRNTMSYLNRLERFRPKAQPNAKNIGILIEEWRADLVRAGLAAKTVNLYTSLVGAAANRHFGKHTVEPVTIQGPRALPRPMPEAVLAKLLLAANQQDNQLMQGLLLLGAYAGLRCGEMADLLWDDLDFDRLEIRVMGKGDKERLVPMHRLVDLHLQRYKQLPCDHDYDAHYLSSKISVFMSKNGAEDWTTHNLRHRFGTQVYQATGDIYLTSKLMGHASVETTAVYAELSSDEKRDAIAAI